MNESSILGDFHEGFFERVSTIQKHCRNKIFDPKKTFRFHIGPQLPYAWSYACYEDKFFQENSIFWPEKLALAKFSAVSKIFATSDNHSEAVRNR